MSLKTEMELLSKDRNKYFKNKFNQGIEYKVFADQVWLFGYEIQNKFIKDYKFDTKSSTQTIFDINFNEVLNELSDSWVMDCDDVNDKVVSDFKVDSLNAKSQEINEIVSQKINCFLKDYKEEYDIVDLGANITTAVLACILKMDEQELIWLVDETEIIKNLLYLSKLNGEAFNDVDKEIEMMREKFERIITRSNYFGSSTLKNSLKNKNEIQMISIITDIINRAYDLLIYFITGLIYRTFVVNKEPEKNSEFIKEAISLHVPFSDIVGISEEEIIIDNRILKKGTKFIFFISAGNLDSRVFKKDVNLNFDKNKANIIIDTENHIYSGLKLFYVIGEIILKEMKNHKEDYKIQEVAYADNFCLGKIDKLLIKKKQTVVFDLDGTICFDGKTIDTNIIDSIKELMNENKIIFASARPIRDIMPVLKSDKSLRTCDLIGGNGSIVKKAGKIYSEKIGTGDIEKIYHKSQIKGHKLLVDSEWDYFYNGDEEHELYKKVDSDNLAQNVDLKSLDKIIKIVLIYNENESSADILKDYGEVLENYKINRYENEKMIDIIPRNTDKHTALVNNFGIAKEDYIAFGNDINDVELLTNAKAGYIIGNNLTIESCRNIKREEITKILENIK